MSLPFLKASRGHTRRLISLLYGSRETLPSKSDRERNKVKAQLQEYLECIKKYDSEVQALLWADSPLFC